MALALDKERMRVAHVQRAQDLLVVLAVEQGGLVTHQSRWARYNQPTK